MKRALIVSGFTLYFCTSASVSFRAEPGRVNGCYQKNTAQLRMVQTRGDCEASEVAVSWNGTASKIRRRTPATITTIQSLGGADNFGFAVNNRGEITGLSRVQGGALHSFVYGKGRVSDISPVNSGHIQILGPTSINNHGQIASGVIVAGAYIPAIYDSVSQKISTLGSFGGATAAGLAGVATSINNAGEAVGYAYLDAVNRHAFLYSKGTLKDLGSFGGFSAATDISDTGTIVGFASKNGRAHAFRYSGGTMSDIDPFGGESYALAVNSRGDIVGNAQSRTGTVFHAFNGRRGAVADLGTLPGGNNSYAQDVNESGLIVGTADAPFPDTCQDPSTGAPVPCTAFKLSAFVYDKGEMIDLNTFVPEDSGWELIHASAVNDRGQIVGYGLLNGTFRAFLLEIAR